MFLIKHWKFIAGSIAVLSLVGAFLWYGHSQYHKGVKNERAVCEAEKQATLQERLKTREKQDNVVRPDTADYIKRLRGESA